MSFEDSTRAPFPGQHDARAYPFDRCGVNAWDGVGPHIEDYIKAKREPYEAICATLPLGSVGYENEANEKGERPIWLEAAMVDLLFPRSATVLCSARRG